ncbi:MAG: glutamate--tRNA ligase [Bacteroidetes bacterium]|nr:glutamate--tRNA ligase [Bacteroidota bacterium]
MSSSKKVRVRFAPSPTGGLHLGGVRTVLYNYLFAKHHGGEFILRIEDTDQKRFVEGAEDYIFQCLEWCGLQPDESPRHEGAYGPYRQSERKHLYFQYAQKLIDDGYAYYAFDTPDELEEMRKRFKSSSNPTPQYDQATRMHMRNSLSLSPEKVTEMLGVGTPYVVRLKMPENTTVSMVDMVRGEVSFETGLVDDKVLLKADGMPTYHLAVVVDDYLMKITHAFRGEEWLPSAPVHLLLWKYLGWEKDMPQWAHLPLILKPDGHGKLSKRDGERLGFPVFAMDWADPNTGEKTIGFRERGFLPDAFINLLALLGWNDGTEQEIFSLEELITRFSMDRVHKGGARFDFEKAKWFNHQYLLQKDNESLAKMIQPFIAHNGVSADQEYLEKVVGLIKERCHLLSDFWTQGHFFFEAPQDIDLKTISEKWTPQKQYFFSTWAESLTTINDWNHQNIEQNFSQQMAESGLKKGDVLLPLRIMLVGGKYGPGVFEIIEMIGQEQTRQRVSIVLEKLKT